MSRDIQDDGIGNLQETSGLGGRSLPKLIMLLGEDKEVFESAALSGIAASKELITKDELLKIMNKAESG